MSDLAKKIIEYRARQNISQKKLAAMCGITEQTMNAIERDLQTPSRLTAEKIRLVIEKEDG